MRRDPHCEKGEELLQHTVGTLYPALQMAKRITDKCYALLKQQCHQKQIFDVNLRRKN